jgi:fucose 4-O-acetylase-like acetyltransferase
MSVASPRRHDLDALRGAAMLAGIVLHGALAFFPFPAWMVQDSQTDPGMTVLVSAIHGFRMSLFFLVSGYFTTLVWRRKGLRSLWWNRAQRIFLPLMLGFLTIVPLLHAVTRYANRPAKGLEVYEAAKKGDLAAVQAAISAGADLNQPGGPFKTTPLILACWGGHDKVVDALLASGADANQKSPDGHPPLHSASFFGRPQVVESLLDAGADPQATNNEGRRAHDGLWADLKTTQAIAGFVQTKVDLDQLIEGRVNSMKLLGGDAEKLRTHLAGQLQSNQAKAKETANPKIERDRSIEALIAKGLYQPFYDHLWFLHFLCWYVLGFGLYVAVVRLFRIEHWPTWLIGRPYCYLYLLPMTYWVQTWMNPRGEGFGPGTSLGWIPMPSVLFYYGIFFAYGAATYDTHASAASPRRRWFYAIIGGVVALGILYPIGDRAGWARDWLSGFEKPRAAQIAIFAMAAYAWVMSFTWLDVFAACLRRERNWIRWISDSSYWLYLAHLPLIVLLQTIIRPWQFSPWLKLMLLCTVTTGILLISYRYLVRYTPIGTLLNGRRHRPGTKPLAEVQT